MISKRVLLTAVAILAVSVTGAMAATVNVGNFNVATLSIGATDSLNLNATNSYGIVSGTVATPVPTPYATIHGYVNAGYNAGAGGTWDGVGGINSSKAAEQATLGTIYTTLADVQGQTAIDWLGAATFYGHTIQGTDSLIRYTYYGDSDMNGIVEGADYGYINYGYAVAGTPDEVGGFMFGDYDRNGVVEGADYGYINYLYAFGGSPLGDLGPAFAAAASAAGAAAVPEPSTLLLLALSGFCAVIAYLRKR